MCDAFGAKGAQWSAVEVKWAKHLVACRQLGVDLGPSEEIECEHCLWDELVPSVWWPACVCAVEDGDQVDFECLNCLFSQVPSVRAGVNWLTAKLLCFDACNEIV